MARTKSGQRRYDLTLAQFPGGGITRWETSHWVCTTYEAMGRDRQVRDVRLRYYNDTPITMTRNRAVKEALADGSDYLLMIDNDIVPDLHEPGMKPFWETAWGFMMERRAREEGGADLPPATIAAPYCGPPPHENIFVFNWFNWETDDPDRKVRLGQYTREQAATFGGIQRVGALPTGLILYDVRLFRELPKPWFAYEWGDDEQSDKASTEDVYQTRNADLQGFPQFCAWDCWAGHVKPKRVRKPNLICVEDVSEIMHDVLLARRHRFRRVVFVDLTGDEEGPRSDSGSDRTSAESESHAKVLVNHDGANHNR